MPAPRPFIDLLAVIWNSTKAARKNDMSGLCKSAKHMLTREWTKS